MKNSFLKKLTRYSPYFFIVLIALISVWPFFKKGFFETHDGDWMIIRFSAFHQALADGQFPVRFVDRLNNNYGYPVLNFLYPLPFYLAEIPKILGFGFVGSIKIIFALSSIFSSLFMYWALSGRFSKLPSMVGAVLYLWVPYRFLDIYVRGSLGENLAFAIIPLILGCIFRVKKGKKIYYSLLSLSTALLILSHNVVAIIFIPILLIIYTLELRKVMLGIVYFSIGIFAASFFWIPALYDLKFVVYNKVQISNVFEHLTSLKNLMLPAWGFGPTPNGPGSFSPQLGLLSIMTLLTTTVLLVSGKLKDKFAVFLICISIIAIFLTLRISSFVWEVFPFIDKIQFPWRLLSVTVFSSTVLVALITEKIQKKAVSLIIIGLAVIINFSYTFPRNFVDREEGFYSTNESTTTVQDEYMPKWVTKKPEQRAYQKIEVTDKAEIENKEIRNVSYKAGLNLKKETTVVVNTVYFPGWKVISNGQEISIKITDTSGLISFQLPKGMHEVIIEYKRTGIHLASELLSLTALILVSIQSFRWRKQNS